MLKEGCKVFHFPPNRRPNVRALRPGSVCLVLVKPYPKAPRGEWAFVGEFIARGVKLVRGEEFSACAERAVEVDESPFPKAGESSWVIEFDHITKYERQVRLSECDDVRTSTSREPLSRWKILGFMLIKAKDAPKVVEAIRKKARYVGPQVPQVSTIYRLELLEKARDLADLVVLLKLFSGKNVLLIGPPGSGKTRFVKELLERLGIGYAIETGNPEWTPFDALGGFGLEPGSFKRGFIFEAAEKCCEAVKEGKLHWLVIDEINRANVDLAFGKFFTLLDPVYRDKEPLRVHGPGEVKEVWVPLSFRVLATMNNYDRALLFKLGYALTRRFAIINHSYLENLHAYYEEYYKAGNRVLERLLELSSTDHSAELKIDYNVIKGELLLCRVGVLQDSITPVDFGECVRRLGEDWREKVYSIEVPGKGNIRLDNVAVGLVREINNSLRKFEEGEICPVQITPGVLADALKYLAIGAYAYNKGLVRLPELPEAKEEAKRAAYAVLLLDSAFSAFIVPQIDVLADYARREEFQYKLAETGRSSLKSVLEEVASKMRDSGLVYSAELMSRLGKGYHVF